MPKTDEEYNALLDQRNSKADFVDVHNKISELATSVHRRIDVLSGDVQAQQRNMQSLHEEMRDIRTQTKETQTWVQDSAKVTREVRDILTTGRLVKDASKWVLVVGAAISTIVAGILFVWGVIHGWFAGK
jgi:phosphatidate phosphatase PAH1